MLMAYAPDVNRAVCGAAHVCIVPHVPAVHATVLLQDDMSVGKDGVTDLVKDRVGVMDDDNEMDGVLDGVIDKVDDIDGAADDDCGGVSADELVGVAGADEDCVGDGDDVFVPVGELVVDCDGDEPLEDDRVGVFDFDGVREDVGVNDGVRDGVGVVDVEREAVRDGVLGPPCEAVLVSVGLCEPVKEGVGDCDRVFDGVIELDGVIVLDGETVAEQLGS